MTIGRIKKNFLKERYTVIHIFKTKVHCVYSYNDFSPAYDLLRSIAIDTESYASIIDTYSEVIYNPHRDLWESKNYAEQVQDFKNQIDELSATHRITSHVKVSDIDVVELDKYKYEPTDERYPIDITPEENTYAEIEKAELDLESYRNIKRLPTEELWYTRIQSRLSRYHDIVNEMDKLNKERVELRKELINEIENL